MSKTETRPSNNAADSEARQRPFNLKYYITTASLKKKNVYTHQVKNEVDNVVWNLHFCVCFFD